MKVADVKSHWLYDCGCWPYCDISIDTDIVVLCLEISGYTQDVTKYGDGYTYAMLIAVTVC